MIVHLIDGTYELFRQYHGRRRFRSEAEAAAEAVPGVLHSILEMIESDATHLGVATDHVVESFRNELWPGYKTAEGIDPELLAQFHPLEEALAALGVVVWPMTELEADDALASAAALADTDSRVDRVCIWTPDKDLAQCVRGERVVQVRRRADEIVTEDGVREKFGVGPELVPDFLALVGDAADGYPGISGIGPVTAARLIGKHGPIEEFPPGTLSDGDRERALIFKDLATLRTDADVFEDVEELAWRGPTPELAEWAARYEDPRLLERAWDAAEGDATES